LGFGFQGLGFGFDRQWSLPHLVGVWSLGFGVWIWGLRFGVWVWGLGFGFRVRGLSVIGSWFWVQGSGFRIHGLDRVFGFEVKLRGSGLRVKVQDFKVHG